MSEVEFRDTAREDAASRALVYDQVKTLYDYTKFHIGLYLTLGTVLAAALSAKESPVHLWHPAIWAAVGFIALAGMAGGIVASTLPGCRSLREFHEKLIRRVATNRRFENEQTIPGRRLVATDQP